MTDAVSRQAVLDLTASEITRRAIKDLQAVPSLDVRRALEAAAEKARVAETVISDLLKRLDEALTLDDETGLSMHSYGQTPDWYVHAAWVSCYTSDAIRALADNPAEMAHIMDAKP